MAGEAAKLQHLHALKHLALIGGLNQPVRVSSSEFATALGLSQQASSALLLDLYKKGLIRRELSARKQHITLTPTGLEALAHEHAELKRIFETARSIEVEGVVSSGLGEGAYYMGLEGYARQFEAHLGHRVVPGTLNLKLEGAEIAKFKMLEAGAGIDIQGFVDKNRTFGGAKLFRCEIDGVEGGVVMPVRTHHHDMLEVISRKQLRKTLKLKDGDKVHVKVFL